MNLLNRFKLFSLVLLLLAAGCSSDGDEKRQEYLDAGYYTRLELPPDLTNPDFSKEKLIPRPSKEAIERFKRDSKDVGKEKTDETEQADGCKK